MNDYCDYYRSISDDYNRIRLDPEEDFNNTISIITNAITLGGTILDIGCGTGKYGERLQKLDYKVKGIDKSVSQIEQATKIIDAQIGVSYDLPFSDESFDACLMIMMLHQLDSNQRQKSFREIYRVLKPNGKLIIKTASHEDIKQRLSSKYFPSAYEEDIKRYPLIETIKSELNKSFYVEVIASKVKIMIPTLEFAQKLKKRRTSNLRNVSDDELNKGIEDYLKDYEKYENVLKDSFNTFVIARKI